MTSVQYYEHKNGRANAKIVYSIFLFTEDARVYNGDKTHSYRLTYKDFTSTFIPYNFYNKKMSAGLAVDVQPGRSETSSLGATAKIPNQVIENENKSELRQAIIVHSPRKEGQATWLLYIGSKTGRRI